MQNTLSVPAQDSAVDYFRENYDNFQIEAFKRVKLIRANNPHTGAVVLIAFRGKQKAPFSRYSYQNEEQREIAAERIKTNEAGMMEWKEKREAERKNFVPEFEVGDIFVGSWGYEQTNVDAYQVVKKVGTHFAMIRPIGLSQVEGTQGHDCCQVIPKKDSFKKDEEPFKGKVGMYGIKINSCITASKWDGESDFYNSWHY